MIGPFASPARIGRPGLGDTPSREHVFCPPPIAKVNLIFNVLLFGCLGGLITWITIPVILERLRFPKRETDFHHVQGASKPRLGGLAMVVSFLMTALAACLCPLGEGESPRLRGVIISSALAMFLLGFWDDLKPLGAKKKLAGQVAIAALTWFDGIHIETFKNPFNGSIHQLGMAGCAITVLWLVALPNLINLIDGIDGLAGGIALMLMGLLCYFGVSASAGFPVLCAAGMVGSLVAFLRYNFPPARIYMGDGGAYFLGFLLAELSIASARKETLVAGLVAPLFVLALPIVDVSLAIVRRGLNGLPIFRPDRGHIHHKLLGIGYSPKRAVLTLYFVSLIFLVFGLFVFWSEGRSAPVLFGVVCLVFIVSAQSFQFSREWFSIGRVFGNSMEMRESIHYGLTLCRWLEMESKYCDSVENLWSDFQFVALKLNFARVKLSLADEQRTWQREAGLPSTGLQHHFRQEFPQSQSMWLEFDMETRTIDDRLFHNLCEITSEAWQRAVTNWGTLNQLPIRFDSRANLAVPARNRKRNRVYVPFQAGLADRLGISASSAVPSQEAVPAGPEGRDPGQEPGRHSPLPRPAQAPSLTARLRHRERILKQEAAGTVVLLDLDGGHYFSLDDAGSRVWDLCDGRHSVAEIVGIVRGEYEAPAETIERDVIELLNDLADEQLLDEDRSKAAAV